MNKTKIMIPLLVAAPTLFACGGGSVAGNYKVQETGKITHKFTVGDEKSYGSSGFTDLSTIKTAIYTKLTKYMDGQDTPNHTVCLSNEMGVEAYTTTDEKITVYPVNLRETSSSTMDMAFEYAKTSTGYHFLGNYIQGYDNLEAYHHISGEGTDKRIEELVVDNGFEVKGQTLTAILPVALLKKTLAKESLITKLNSRLPLLSN
ncbi:MAG: hypothetical protein MJ206_03575 [Bacilli bacterium]|nr:hypothetical protein [Bacilli bacterium]